LTIGDPWRIRVVPNLYPAFERQEVVVHSPEHVRTIADLDNDQLAFVAQAWRTRREQEPAGYLHALVNEGRAAGGSLAHSHSQLVWLARTPPAVEKEQPFALDGEPVLERDGVAAVLPRAGRVPYEGLVAPVDSEPDAWTSERLATALQLLSELTRRIHAVAGGPVPLNAWLHTGKGWHIEVFPRLTVLAGVELGAEVYVNTVAPEEAAEQLRGV
jgi:UDPglucose--hexose-1-phosphate uridylyltransferase